ncbi:MAG: hypothetical protein U0M13_09760, partial [Desulfovibrio fairfieldensis]|nr:hypothetical protein [Desulfovibrio fairfieldensis]
MSDITPFLPSQLYGVIGWPLAQSLSPLLHNSGFQALGIPAVYLRWEVPPERLAAFVDSVRLLGIRDAHGYRIEGLGPDGMSCFTAQCV